MKILLSNNQYIHLPFIAHTCARQMYVRDNNVYEAQTCASFYYLNDSTDQYTGRWRSCECNPKDELPNQRGCLAKDIPSRATEPANQEFQQDDHHSQHVSNAQ